MSRREAVRRVGALLGGAVSAPALAGVLGGCRVGAPDSSYRLQVLDSRLNDLVAVIAEHIIPRTDSPGARDVGVNEFIDLMLAEWYPEDKRNSFLAGLDAVDADAENRHGRRFLECTDAEQVELLHAVDRAAYAHAGDEGPAPFFRTMKELTLLGYYTSEVGSVQELRWVPIPGRYDGCVPIEVYS